jgi:hypothetical protein
MGDWRYKEGKHYELWDVCCSYRIVPSAVVMASDFGVSIEEVQLGEYIVTFPEGVRIAGCVATQNSSVGSITATPGSNSALSPNQVRVLTLNLDNSFAGGVTYTLVVFYPIP